MNSRFRLFDAASATITVNRKKPAPEGLPERTPELDRVIPGGGDEPAAKDHRYGGLPPSMGSWIWDITPATIFESLRESLWSGLTRSGITRMATLPLESVSRTVTGYEPAR